MGAAFSKPNIQVSVDEDDKTILTFPTKSSASENLESYLTLYLKITPFDDGRGLINFSIEETNQDKKTITISTTEPVELLELLQHMEFISKKDADSAKKRLGYEKNCLSLSYSPSSSPQKS